MLNKKNGFTLVEILVVIAILGVLITMLAVGILGSRVRAKIAASKATVILLTDAINQYYQDFKQYPPDGHDGAAAQGRKGSTALLYYLALDHVMEQTKGSGPASYKVKKDVGPYINDFRQVPLSIKKPKTTDMIDHIDNNPGCEVMDAFKRPIQYDNIKNGQFTPMGTNPHHFDGKWDSKNALDPRAGKNDLQKQPFHVWSNGKPDSQSGWKPSPIASWEMNK